MPGPSGKEASEERHSQNWREYLTQERARVIENRGWLKHQQHMNTQNANDFPNKKTVVIT